MGGIGLGEKICDLVTFPIRGLDVREYVAELREAPEPVFYDLYAVSNHFGILNGGHYTANCYNEHLGKWLTFDDSQVKPCSEEDVVNSAAYILFYKKR